MKRRALSLLLMFTFLMSMVLFCTTAFAAVHTADGITAELTTDKDAYANGEAIAASLKVYNDSTNVGKIRTKLILPAYLELGANGGQLESGEVNIPEGSDTNYNYGLTASVPGAPIGTTSSGTTSATTVPGATTTVTTVPGTTVAGTTVPGTTVAGTTVPGTTVAGTTVAGTTVAGTTGNPDGPSDTGDISLYIYGALGLFSLVGLLVLAGGLKGLIKNKYLMIILCLGLLLPLVAPVALAATNERSFEVTHTVTVNGTPQTLKAVVTYEVNVDEMPDVATQTVVFKENGASLYSLVPEKGWYTGENKSIEIDGVTASPTTRPEVTASYIDMLFGGIKNKTGESFKGEFDNSKILVEGGKELLVGLTTDAASRKALEYIGYDEWIIIEIDGKLVVTGWFDNATVAAARYLYNQVAAESDKTLSLPVVGNMDGVIADAADVVPQSNVGNFMGGLDGDEDTTILRFENMNEAKFLAYAAQLEAAGFDLYAENKIVNYGEAYNLFRTYTKGKVAVHVAYYPNEFVDVDPAGLSANELKALNTSFRPYGKEMRIIIDSVDNLFTHAAENDYVDAGIKPQLHIVNLFNQVADGNNNAECLIYTLADGSFIVADGGFAQDADHVFKALTQLNQREDGKIVVAAWIMSHHHNDHMGAFTTMATKEYAKDIYIEQFIMNPSAVSYVWRNRNAPYNYSSSALFGPEYYSHAVYEAYLDNFGGTLDGGKTQMVNPHAGQKMYIRNAQVEFLYAGDEDLWPVHVDNDNDSSLVYSVEFGKETETPDDDSRTLILNDSCRDAHGHNLLPLFLEMLDCDIVQVAHHGLGGPTSAIYRNMEPSIGIWCTTKSVSERNNWFNPDPEKRTGASYVLVLRPEEGDDNDPVDLVLFAEDYVQTLYLPFREGDVIDKVRLTDYVSNAYVNENINVAFLPDRAVTENNYAALLNELAGYNADVVVMTNSPALDAGMVEAMLEDLDYTYSACTAGDPGHLILSRYPISSAKTVAIGTDSICNAMLDVDGVPVEIYATDLSDDTVDEFTAALTGENKPTGKYWMIVGDCASYGSTVSAVAPVAGNLSGTYDVYIGGSEHATVEDKKTPTSNTYTFTAVLPRYYITEGTRSKTEAIDLMLWTVNGWGQTQTPKDVVLGELKYVHPEIAILPMVDNIKMPMDLAEIAAFTGYQYYSFVEAETNNINYPDRDDLSRGTVIFSDYPIDTNVESVTVGDVTFTNKLVLEEDTPEVEGRAFGRVAITINGVKTDVWFGFNASTLVQERALIPYVQAAAEASGRPFIVAGYRFKELSTIYAGKNVQSYMSTDWQGVVVSSDGYPVGSFTEYARANIGLGDNKFMMEQVWVTFDSTPVNISFNANGGAGTMASDTSLKGMYELPVCAFTAPEGKRFKGWSTSANGEVIYRLDLKEDVELFAIWTDEKNVLFSSTYNNFLTSESGRKYFVDYYKQNNFDIVAMKCVAAENVEGDKLKQLAEDMGYPYYFAATNAAGESALLFSKYEIKNPEAIVDGEFPILYATVEISGRPVDICVSQMPKQAHRNYIKSILNARVNADRELIVTGSVSNATSDLITVTGRTLSFFKGDYSNYWFSGDIELVEGHTDTEYTPPVSHMVDPVNVELKITEKPVVTFNANGGTQGPTYKAATWVLGSLTPSEHIFQPPAGKTFAGWATSANGTPAKTVNITEDTTLYAIWEDYNYPAYKAPTASDITKKISAFQLWGVGTDFTSWDQYTAYISKTANHTDISVLIHAVIAEDKIDAVRQATGYEYSYFVAADAANNVGHLLFSEYPIAEVGTYTLPYMSDWAPAPSNEGRAFAYVSLNVGGTAIDLVMGENNGNSYAGHRHNILLVEPWVESLADDRTNPLMIVGYKMNRSQDTSFNGFTKLGDNNGQYVLSAAIASGNYADLAKLSGHQHASAPAYVELTFVDKSGHTVSYNANGGSGIMKNEIVPEGNFTLPANGFTAPNGAKFMGWSLTKDGAIIDSVTVSGDVTVYARWSTETLKVLAWQTNVFGNNSTTNFAAGDANIVTILNEIKSEDPDIAVIHRASNQRATKSVEEIVAASGYPFYYYAAANKADPATTGFWYGNIVLSKYPLAYDANASLYSPDAESNAAGSRYCVGYCVADLGSEKVDLFVSVDMGGDVIGKVSSYVETVNGANAGRDFILCNTGSNTVKTTFGGKDIVQIIDTDDKIEVLTSTQNLTVDSTTSYVKTKPAALSTPLVVDEIIVNLSVAEKHTVSFNANGGTGTMTAVTAKEGAYTLPANGFTAPNGGKFLGWSLTKDGPVIDSLTLNSNVTLYARWQAVNLKVMGWRIGNLGATKNNYTAIINEVKAQNPDIVGLMLADNSAGWHADKTPQTIANDLPAYPFYYYVSEYGTDTETTWKGHIIFSKFPLTDKVESNHEKTSANAFIGHCVVDLGTFKLDLFATSDMRMATRDSLYAYVQTVTATSGNDFVILASGALPTDLSSCAGKTVATSADGSKIATVVSLSNLKLESVVAPFDCSTIGNYGDSVCKETIVNVSVKQSYTVSFNANGGTGTMTAVTANEGAYTLPANGFTAPTGKRFIGWSLTADGEVLSSLDLTEDVTLHARWGADTVKIMGWRVINFGLTNGGYNAVIAEVKAQDADIVGLLCVGNNHTNIASKTVAGIVADCGYPYSYYVPETTDSGTSFMGHLILSKYPLTDKVESNFTKTVDKGDSTSAEHNLNIGYCVADLGTTKLDIFVTSGMKYNTRDSLYAEVQKVNAITGNGFVILASGALPNTMTTCAGKNVAISSDGSQISTIISLDEVNLVEAKTPFECSTTGKTARISLEAIITITVK